jgi:hypothetical protein
MAQLQASRSLLESFKDHALATDQRRKSRRLASRAVRIERNSLQAFMEQSTDESRAGVVTAREWAIGAHRTLLNSGKLSYFEERGLPAEPVRAAWVGYAAASGAFVYPASPGVAVSSVSTTRARGATRRGSAGSGGAGTPRTCRTKGTARSRTLGEGHTIRLENPREPRAGLARGLVLRRGGRPERAAGGLRGFIPTGAGLLEPAYAKEFRGLEVVVFYDAGEEQGKRAWTR